MQVSSAVMQVSMRNPSCQCVMHVSSRNASFLAVMQSVPTGNASFPTEVFPASMLIKESTTTTTSTTWCGEVDMTTIISNPCRPFRSEVGRSAARQPGSQAAASRLQGGRQASKHGERKRCHVIGSFAAGAVCVTLHTTHHESAPENVKRSQPCPNMHRRL